MKNNVDDCPTLPFESASFDSAHKRLTAIVGNTSYEFDVYTQEDLDNYMTIENCALFLEEHCELSERFSSYREWALCVFSYDEQYELMLDTSYSKQWPDLCRMAGVDYNDYPYSSLCHEDNLTCTTTTKTSF
jgi:hypothetical protein